MPFLVNDEPCHHEDGTLALLQGLPVVAGEEFEIDFLVTGEDAQPGMTYFFERGDRVPVQLDPRTFSREIYETHAGHALLKFRGTFREPGDYELYIHADDARRVAIIPCQVQEATAVPADEPAAGDSGDGAPLATVMTIPGATRIADGASDEPPAADATEPPADSAKPPANPEPSADETPEDSDSDSKSEADADKDEEMRMLEDSVQALTLQEQREKRKRELRKQAELKQKNIKKLMGHDPQVTITLIITTGALIFLLFAMDRGCDYLMRHQPTQEAEAPIEVDQADIRVGDPSADEAEAEEDEAGDKVEKKKKKKGKNTLDPKGFKNKKRARRHKALPNSLKALNKNKPLPSGGSSW